MALHDITSATFGTSGGSPYGFTLPQDHRTEPVCIKANQYQSLGLNRKPIIHYIINYITLLYQ